MKIDDIIEEMQSRVENNVSVSPASWIEAAIRVNALAFELDDKMASLEATMTLSESCYVQEGMTSAKAKQLSRLSIDYSEYLKLKAKLKRIENFIITARKRSQVQDI